MTLKLLTEHHSEFLNLNGGCAGSSESTLVKMIHCWKSHVTALRLGGTVAVFYYTRISVGHCVMPCAFSTKVSNI